MWRNYLTVGVRALTRHKTYAFINIFGLALGLAACLLLLLYVRHETSYDSWLPDADRVFQVQTRGFDPESGDRLDSQAVARPVAAALAKDFPQIEAISKAETGLPTILRNGDAIAAEMVMVDEPFFEILPVPFLRGNRESAMDGADGVAMSRTQASKLFGSIDIIGETLTIVDEGGKRDLKVTGVFEDLPKNSHLGFSLVGRFKETWECGWSCTNGNTYVKLKPGVDVAEINREMPAWEKRNVTPEMMGGTPVNEGDKLDWLLVNIRDVHLSGAGNGARPGNDRTTIVTFSIVAALILAMACINFTNLATARASQRAREVALRKVLGANRRQLIAQFLGESMLLAAFAMLIALALVELALPAFSAFLDAELDLHYLGEGGLIAPILALMLIVGLAGGVYPAFYLSRYQPATVLKANKSAAETPGSGRLRNILVVGQFAVSIGLISCTLIVYHQTLFARTSDAGFTRVGLIQIEGMNTAETEPLRETIARQIAQIDGVTGVSGTYIVPASGQTLYTNIQMPGRAEPEQIGWYSVEPGFLETMKIDLVAGRALSREYAKDNAIIDATEQEAAEAEAQEIVERGVNIMLNEEAAERLGFASPQEAIGKQVNLQLFVEELGLVPATIVGVTENSRFRSLREPFEPTIYYDVGQYRRLVVRYDSDDPNRVMDGIRQVWKRVAPEVPLEAEFTEDKLGALYAADARRGTVFAGFSLLAVVIACLGLFGLAAFTAERRTKEIGIRKVFGARVRDIVRLLTWQFSKPVIIANLIAWPAAWWVMRDWLNSFDDRIALTPTPFALAGLIALAIAIGTIAGHAIRVARLNPVHALRYE
jgi:putative ABC transport system permease protein